MEAAGAEAAAVASLTVVVLDAVVKATPPSPKAASADALAVVVAALDAADAIERFVLQM